MSYYGNRDYALDIVAGRIPNTGVIHKFGFGTVGSTPIPVEVSGNYQVPTTPTSLEILSSSANDTAAGSGAQEITIQGVVAGWMAGETTVELNGTTAVAIDTQFLRVFRWFVSRSGTYATQNVGSHSGTITIRGAGGGATWSQIASSPFAFGQSEIGAYTIPINKIGYLKSKSIFVNASKEADVYFFQRPNADDITTPFTGAMRLFEREIGLSGGFQIGTYVPKGPFVGPCDIGFIGYCAIGNAEVSVEFELILEDT